MVGIRKSSLWLDARAAGVHLALWLSSMANAHAETFSAGVDNGAAEHARHASSFVREVEHGAAIGRGSVDVSWSIEHHAAY